MPVYKHLLTALTTLLGPSIFLFSVYVKYPDAIISACVLKCK